MVLRYEGNDFVCIFSHWNSTRAQNMKHVFKQNSFICGCSMSNIGMCDSEEIIQIWAEFGQGSRQKLNYDINSKIAYQTGEILYTCQIQKVSPKISSSLCPIWSHVFMNTLPESCEVWCPE